MKLRNKKTGEIIEILAKPSFVKRNDNFLASEVNSFDSLAELNEEWEDYKEPKPLDYWRIDCDGEIINDKYDGNNFDKACEVIGNYYETEEEAKKAVEKLKAWKRLKDKGLEFRGWTTGDELKISICTNFDGYNIFSDSEKESKMDLDLLFED